MTAPVPQPGQPARPGFLRSLKPRAVLESFPAAPRRRPWLIVALSLAGLLLAGAGGLFAFVTFWPQAAAQSADALRAVIGDSAVAQLETAISQAQDALRQFEYKTGLVRPDAPWENQTPAEPAAEVAAAEGPAGESAVAVAAPAEPTATLPAGEVTPTPGSAEPSASEEETASDAGAGPVPVVTAAPAAASEAAQDQAAAQRVAALSKVPPEPLQPMGTLKHEGVWVPYIFDQGGQPVAYRTFLQPDPERPYVTIGLVTFDLEWTRLHFVLGSQEPAPDTAFKRSGRIPATDLQSGLLIAAFNGGFKARHGHFGAMADGQTAIAASDGLATVAVAADGSVRMGVWGQGLYSDPDWMAWRQNGPPLVQAGAVNAHTEDESPEDWGVTVGKSATVWRSALGLSADNRWLTYAAGANLTLPVLAQAMLTARTVTAMQLDINAYWVHFDRIEKNGEFWAAKPLEKEMAKDAYRYLNSSTRDFFYVTLTPP